MAGAIFNIINSFIFMLLAFGAIIAVSILAALFILVIFPLSILYFLTFIENIKFLKNKDKKMVAGILGLFGGLIIGGLLVLASKDEIIKVIIIDQKS